MTMFDIGKPGTRMGNATHTFIMGDDPSYHAELPTAVMDLRFYDSTSTLNSVEVSTDTLDSYFTRSSVAWKQPSTVGAWEEFAVDTMRRHPNGWLCEATSTNEVPNAIADGSVSGTPGTPPTGWSMTTGVTGVPHSIRTPTPIEGLGLTGLPTRIEGQVQSTDRFIIFSSEPTAVAVTPGEIITVSYYASRTGWVGLLPQPVWRVSYYTAEGVLVQQSDQFTGHVHDPIERYGGVHTVPANPTIAHVVLSFGINMNAGNTFYHNYNYFNPQIERGSRVSSVMLSAGTPFTRDGDKLRIPAADTGVTATTGALFCRVNLPNRNIDETTCLADLSDAAGDNRVVFEILATTGQLRQAIYAGGALVAERVYAGSIAVNAELTIGATWDATSARFGTTFGGSENVATGSAPVAFDTLSVGSYMNTENQANGLYKRTAAFDTRLSNQDFDNIVSSIHEGTK